MSINQNIIKTIFQRGTDFSFYIANEEAETWGSKKKLMAPINTFSW